MEFERALTHSKTQDKNTSSMKAIIAKADGVC